MFKKLVSDGALYGFSGSVAKGVQIFLIPIYTHTFSPSEYGVMELFIVFAALINLTAACEISMAVARFYGTSNSDEDKRQYASSALWFSVFAYLLFFIITFLFSVRLNLWWFESVQWLYVFQVALVAMACNGIYIFLLDLLRWQQRPKFYTLTSILYSIMTILFSLYFVLILKIGIVGVYYGQIISAIFGIIFVLFFSRGVYVLNFYFDKCKEMLKYSFPLVFSSLAVFINLNVDRIAISHFMTISDVGIYGIGFRIASVMTLILMGIQAALFPLVLQTHKEASTPENLADILRYIMLLVFAAIIALGLFSEEIIELIAAPEFSSAKAVVPVLALTFFFANPYNFAPGLHLVNKTKIVAFIGICIAFINILLNIFFIPLGGIFGAALATFIAALFGFFATLYFSQIYYPIPYKWKPIIKATALTLITLIFSHVIFTGIDNQFLYKLSLLFAIYLIVTFFLLKKSEILKLLHKIHL